MKEKYKGMRQNIWPVLCKATAVAALALGYALRLALDYTGHCLL